MNITSLGVGSGLDLESIVEAFINAESVPQEIRLQAKEEKLTLEISGVGSFKSALSAFDTILKKLTAPDAFNKQLISTSSDIISVESNGFASNGNFDVQVEQLAEGTRLQSQTFANSASVVGSGTLTIDAGAGVDAFDVIIDVADSLSVIRDKINEQVGNFGVTANVITSDAGSFLVFDSSITGSANSLTITTSDVSLDGISTNNTTEQSAQDAIIYIDGNKSTNSTNKFQNIIEDVTITAKQVEMATPATLSISQDKENGTTLVNEFVDGFNELINALVGLGAPKQGRLAFDPNVRQIKQQMTNTIIDNVPGLSGSIQSLRDIGIDLNKSGLLEITSFSATSLASGKDRLSDALENHLADVGNVFASTDGVANKISALADSYISTNGTLTTRLTSLNEQLDGIGQEYTDLEDRLRDYEATLRKRFTFLDNTVAKYTATGDFLTSALASFNNNNKK